MESPWEVLCLLAGYLGTDRVTPGRVYRRCVCVCVCVSASVPACVPVFSSGVRVGLCVLGPAGTACTTWLQVCLSISLRDIYGRCISCAVASDVRADSSLGPQIAGEGIKRGSCQGVGWLQTFPPPTPSPPNLPSPFQ